MGRATSPILQDFIMDKKELQESIDYFDNFVNAAISQDIEGFGAIDVVKHYSNIKNRLAELLVDKE
jgi:hypothetical protein